MAQSQPTVIGSKELVDFPDLLLKAVPAKVDTGADSSAIWASRVRQVNDQLSFVLFGRQSPFYTGKVIKTKQFTVTSVKNSFGQTELRYKVRLNVVIAGRRLSAKFTLANRSKNRFPILIGRRTLKGKFIVDVAQKNGAEAKVLFLYGKPIQTVARFADHLASDKYQLASALYDDLVFAVDADKTSVTLGLGGPDLSTFDLVIFKTTSLKYLDVVSTAARYLRQRGIPMVDPVAADLSDTGKLYQSLVLAEQGVAVPSSIVVAADRLVESFDHFKQKLGLPFVLKDIHGAKGRANYLIRTKADFMVVARQAAAQSSRFMAQAYIDNDGDYRLLVMGDKIALVIHRKRRTNDTHLNNTSAGGQASLAAISTLPVDIKRTALFAAELFGRSVAGVDMLQDKSSQAWYCLEVNDGPQLATGAFREEKRTAFVKFIESEIRKS